MNIKSCQSLDYLKDLHWFWHSGVKETDISIDTANRQNIGILLHAPIWKANFLFYILAPITRKVLWKCSSIFCSYCKLFQAAFARPKFLKKCSWYNHNYWVTWAILNWVICVRELTPDWLVFDRFLQLNTVIRVGKITINWYSEFSSPQIGLILPYENIHRNAIFERE